MPYLQFEKLGRVPISETPFVIGRSGNCNLVLDDAAVSREHARIVGRQGEFFIEDLKSLHGVYVNGHRITTETRLQDNDAITLSHNNFAFHEEENPEPLTIAVSAISADLTREQLLEVRPEVKLRALLDINQSLQNTLDMDELLPKILDCVLRIFPQAQTGSVLLVNGETHELVPKATRNRNETDATSVRISHTVVQKALEKRQAIHSKDAYADSQFTRSESISLYGIRSIICAPLLGQNRDPLGVLEVHTEDSVPDVSSPSAASPHRKPLQDEPAFDEDDLNVLVSVATTTAMAIENARLHEEQILRERILREKEFARDVQRRFLPSRVPHVPGYSFYRYYEPASSVGGDYYGFIELPNQRQVIALGDVSGKGMPAALLMARLSSDVRYSVTTNSDPATALQVINGALAEAELEDRFVTLLLMVIDASQHSLTIANAGHLRPLLRHPNGKVEELGASLIGLPLNVSMDPGYQYQSTTVFMKPGSCVLAYTDGVTEARSGEAMFGLERLEDLVRSGPSEVEKLGTRVIQSVLEFAGGAAQHDDTTLVCFGREAE